VKSRRRPQPGDALFLVLWTLGVLAALTLPARGPLHGLLGAGPGPPKPPPGSKFLPSPTPAADPAGPTAAPADSPTATLTGDATETPADPTATPAASAPPADTATPAGASPAPTLSAAPTETASPTAPLPPGAPTETVTPTATPTPPAAAPPGASATPSVWALVWTPTPSPPYGSPTVFIPSTPVPLETRTPIVAGAAGAPIVLSLLHAWDDAYAAQAGAIFAEYTQAHPEVRVELHYIPGGSLDIEISNTVAGAPNPGVGSPPDIVARGADGLRQYIAWGAAVPLEQYGADAAYMAAHYAPVAVAAGSEGGHVYNLPSSLSSLAMLYNPRLIAPADLPRTTSELRARMAAYDAAHPGEVYAAWDPKDAGLSEWLFYGAGADWIDNDNHVQLPAAETAGVLSYVNSLRGLLPENLTYAMADTLFRTGRAPIMFMNPGYARELTQAGLPVAVAPLPAVDFGRGGPARPFVWTDGLTLTKWARHPQEAVAVMQYFTARDAQIRLARALGRIPSSPQAAAALAGDPSIAGFYAQALAGVPLPHARGIFPVWGSVSDGLAAAFTGRLAPADAAAALQLAAERAAGQQK
jgi:maltose-binding protein MalE